jgi:uncharacterized protein YbaP (TraB family)
MDKARCLLILLFLWPVLPFCQVQDSAYPKTFLWEISGNGLTVPSYLYGTVHVICETDAEMPEVLKQKIKGSKNLYLECLPLKKTDSIPKEVLLQGDTTLMELVGEHYYGMIEKLLDKQTGFRRPDLLNKLKPFYVGRILESIAMPCHTVSYENVFMDLAKEEKIPIKGLESTKEHMDVVDNLSLKMQVFQLKIQLENPDLKVKGIQQMLELYKQKELLKLYNKTMLANRFEKKFKPGLIDDRNVLWIPKMVRAMKNEMSFFAVGCAHLPGQNGVINLLRDEGYTVTPILY